MAQQTQATANRTVRDRFWIWTHQAATHNVTWPDLAGSRMTPVEGAVYLDVPNLYFIRYENKPPLEEFERYAISFRPMRRVLWSLTGAGGATSDEERRCVLDLAARFPNITGFIMDDFFRPDNTGALSPAELEAVRGQLVIGGRRRDLHVVLYNSQLALPVRDHLAFCDTITFWTWTAGELPNLDQNFAALERLAPRQRKVLGCYLYDYGASKPMPVDLMRRQCERGLEWLRAGRIEGMIFLSNNSCDVGLEAVEFTRNWIAQLGDQK